MREHATCFSGAAPMRNETDFAVKKEMFVIRGESFEVSIRCEESLFSSLLILIHTHSTSKHYFRYMLPE
jgi:hypothetical protein